LTDKNDFLNLAFLKSSFLSDIRAMPAMLHFFVEKGADEEK
jgi:hypothetical protein